MPSVHRPWQAGVQTGRQPCSMVRHASVGPHMAHCVPYLVFGGQSIGQNASVQASVPSSQLHLLQLVGSGMPLVPLGYTTPPTLHDVARSGASSQLPAAVQVAGPGATHGGHGVMHDTALACFCRSESSATASVLLALTGVEHPQLTTLETLAWH